MATNLGIDSETIITFEFTKSLYEPEALYISFIRELIDINISSMVALTSRLNNKEDNYYVCYTG